jgi:uncharacterized protein (UPF0261 family)
LPKDADVVRIMLAGTCDTKAAELGYLAGLLRAGGAEVRLVDVGTRAPGLAADVPAAEVAAHHPEGVAAVLGGDDRGRAVAAMGLAFARFMATETNVAGVLGIGGGGGTSILCEGLRGLPYGLPRIVVSTLAAGDVAPYIGISDLILMPAVTDFAGLNRLSRVILHNAAQAILGMARHPAPRTGGRPAVGLTMFGVTTPCVMALAEGLRDRYDPMVFHATGTGGRTMEKLADDGLLAGFLDITTTEVADLLFGGVLPATPDRFGAVARTGLPWLGSVGACDMVNFGPPDTVPSRLSGRRFYHHNPQVTLMRTTPEESAAIGAWIAARLNRCDGPVCLLLPEGGISALDAPGRPFDAPEARAALFGALEGGLTPTPRRRILRLPHHINDPAFAAACLAEFAAIAR